MSELETYTILGPSEVIDLREESNTNTASLLDQHNS